MRLLTCVGFLLSSFGFSFGAADVAGLLDRYCISCHDDELRKGKLSLEGVGSFEDAGPELWAVIREKLQLREMPPRKKKQPSEDEKAALESWIAGELRAGGYHVSNKLELPNYGNYVDHKALFDKEPHPAPATLVRAWRVRPAVFDRSMGRGVQPFSMLPGQQISDYSALYSVDESGAEIALRNAQKVVELQTKVEIVDGRAVPLKEKGARVQSFMLPLLHENHEATDEEVRKAINWQFHQAIMRAPTDDEYERVLNLKKRVTKKYGKLNGARAALTVPLLMPEAMYRLELGAGELDEYGRRRLSTSEIAAAIHYALWETRPNGTLGKARKAELSTSEQVATFTESLMTKWPPDRVITFFNEYFDYRKAGGIFKEPPKGLSYNAGLYVRDAETLIRHVVKEDKEVLRELLTTNHYYASNGQGYSRGYSRVYGLPFDFKPRNGERVELPADQRLGLLTHPAWLIAQSGNFDNDPVRRGKWIREHLLGSTIPDLPISVCAVVPEDEGKTLRERFEVIRNDKYCWQCHDRMNPVGMPFEAYDHFGRFRLRELKKPVVTSGGLTETLDPAIEGDVSDALELIRKIAGTERTRQVFVRYAFRFFLGRNETVRDAKTLQDANRAYAESGGSMKALVLSLLSSDSFLYRAPEL